MGEIYVFSVSYNIMERGLGPGDMHIATRIVIGLCVGYLMGPR